MNNPFEVLGLKGWADQDEIRAAYRMLVKQCHPDMIQDPVQKQEAQDRMVALNLAYEEALRLASPKAAAAIASSMAEIPAPAALLMAEQALALFASTSPSYLILQSLDAVNPLLAGAYPGRIRETAAKVEALKASLRTGGWTLYGQEPLKLCLLPKPFGYTGEDLAILLQGAGIVAEFSDPDHLVLMISPENTEAELRRLDSFLLSLPRLPAIQTTPPPLPTPQSVLSPREALLSPFETLPAERCLGRILATPCVGCPPAVPIAVCGERLGPEALALFGYYGIEDLDVVL